MNPYGINCDSCGFINTPKATLTTSAVAIESGQLNACSADAGVRLIQAAAEKLQRDDDHIRHRKKVTAEHRPIEQQGARIGAVHPLIMASSALSIIRAKSMPF